MSRPASAPAPAASAGTVELERTRFDPTPTPTAPAPSNTAGEVSALASEPARLGAAVTTRLEVVNAGSAPVCGLFVSAVSEGTWGDDRLGEGHTIPPGSSHSLVLPAGSYDVRVTGCSDDVLVERNALSVQGAGVRVSVH